MSTGEFGPKTFWGNIHRNSKGCWLWTKRKFKTSGYGQVCWKGKTHYAHRLAWSIHHKRKVPPGKHVLHTCDVRPCINPDHLYLGNRRKNMQDMVERGRARLPDNRGDRNGMSKLTTGKVRQIKLKLSKGIGQTKLARQYNVNFATIFDIRTGRTWRHV